MTNLEFVRGAVANLSFAKAAFTLVFTRFALHHLSDPRPLWPRWRACVVRVGGGDGPRGFNRPAHRLRLLSLLSCLSEGCNVRVNVAIEVASVQVRVPSHCRVSPARQSALCVVTALSLEARTADRAVDGFEVV